MMFKLNLQLLASKKGVGSTKNGRDSAGGTRIYPGENTKKGKDDTIFATANGIVKFERLGKDRKMVRVIADK